VATRPSASSASSDSGQPLCIGGAGVCRDRHGHNQQRHDRKEGHENCGYNRPASSRPHQQAKPGASRVHSASHINPVFC